MKEHDDWRKPSEKPPPFYERVLVVWDGDVTDTCARVEVARFYPEGWKIVGLPYFAQSESIKFWQPLPSLPEA